MLKHAEFAIKTAVVQESASDTVPWDLLDAGALRKKLLVKPETFSHVETLDPMRMSLPDLYNVLALLVKGQDSGVRLLEFSVEKSDTDTDVEISELIDPPAQSPEQPALPRDVGPRINNASTALDSDASPPQSSPSLSNLKSGMIKVAIGKVAEAGYLHLISGETTTDAPNQVLTFETAFQQGGNEETSNHHCKKRRRRGEEEMGWDGSNEDKPTKKRNDKKAVPSREQSSRYDRLDHFYQLTDISF
jgi:hypothetical protein